MASTSGRSSRSTFTGTKRSFRICAMSAASNDSSSITWHQWQVAYPMLRKIGRSSARARARVVSPGAPVDRIVRVLQQVRAGLQRQPVRPAGAAVLAQVVRAELLALRNGLGEPRLQLLGKCLRPGSRLDGHPDVLSTVEWGHHTTMRAYDLIRKKRDGGTLAPEELRFLVRGATTGEVADEQLAAFLMAVFFRGMDLSAELPHWLDAMLRSGEVLDLSRIAGTKVDKHSTGGVGDKISIPLAPLAAVCGVRVPMVSGRGLGHTGGTLDKLESIPGFRIDLPIERFAAQVDEIGACMIGQTARIAPADKRLYALRDVTATIESLPMIAASIMSKKLAEGIDGLVIDCKVGRGAFMKTIERARELC